MPKTTTDRRRPDRAAGFTLVELLVAVAVIGMLASIAIPALQAGMAKARRNAAVQDLRLLREALVKYAADNSGYPGWGRLNPRTLSPLGEAELPRKTKILRRFRNEQIDLYLPWNILLDPLTDDIWSRPSSFFIMATMASDPDLRFIVTDGQIYTYIQGEIEPADNNW